MHTAADLVGDIDQIGQSQRNHKNQDANARADGSLGIQRISRIQSRDAHTQGPENCHKTEKATDHARPPLLNGEVVYEPYLYLLK
jgi:hypothetical protein